MQRQLILRERFLDKLKSDVEHNLHRYELAEPWLDDVFGQQVYSLESTIDVPDGFFLVLPDANNLRDLENTRIVYEAMRGLTRLQAADPRVWTYLSHVTFWKYMRRRWDLGKSRAQDRKDYVLSRYFVKSDQSRSLLRNGMARLWWYGYLTFDVDRENPYELTGVLLRLLDIAQQVLERSYGRNSAILHGFLEFILLNSELMESGNVGRKRIRQLAVALNLHGGVCILDNLNKSDIKEFLSGALAQITTSGVAEAGEAEETEGERESEESF